MNTWSFYDPATGLFANHVFSSSDPNAVAAHTPVGLVPVAGHHDAYSRRVNLADGTVVDWQPPQPDSNHVWDATAKRWVLNAVADTMAAGHARALATIERIERAQVRTLCDLLTNPNDKAAQKRHGDFERDKATARAAVLATPPVQRRPELPKPLFVDAPGTPPAKEPAPPLRIAPPSHQRQRTQTNAAAADEALHPVGVHPLAAGVAVGDSEHAERAAGGELVPGRASP